MNCVILTGNLTRDPELKYLPGGGNAVTTFTVAVQRPFKNKEGNYEADFIPVQVWGRSAENAANYLRKGSRAGVSGRLQVRSYEDKEGNKRWVTEVVADRVEFLDSKGAGEQKQEPKGLADDGFAAIEDDLDLIPF